MEQPGALKTESSRSKFGSKFELQMSWSFQNLAKLAVNTFASSSDSFSVKTELVVVVGRIRRGNGLETTTPNEDGIDEQGLSEVNWFIAVTDKITIWQNKGNLSES